MVFRYLRSNVSSLPSLTLGSYSTVQVGSKSSFRGRVVVRDYPLGEEVFVTLHNLFYVVVRFS